MTRWIGCVFTLIWCHFPLKLAHPFEKELQSVKSFAFPQVSCSWLWDHSVMWVLKCFKIDILTWDFSSWTVSDMEDSGFWQEDSWQNRSIELPQSVMNGVVIKIWASLIVRSSWQNVSLLVHWSVWSIVINSLIRPIRSLLILYLFPRNIIYIIRI